MSMSAGTGHSCCECGPASIAAPNPQCKNLLSHTNYAGGPGQLSSLQQFQQSYGYDAVNRVTASSDYSAGTCGGTCWYRNFQYDQWGNLWVTANGGLPLAGNMPVSNIYNSASNQMNGQSYHAAGNQFSVNGNNAYYDAENRMVSLVEPQSLGGGTETYAYDGNGDRVQKIGSDGGITAYT